MTGKLATTLSVLLLLIFVALAGPACKAAAQQIEANNYGGIAYLSGGIGLDEREQMERMGEGYNLKLIFALQQGNFVSDVKVTITDGSGKVLLDAVSDGPWLYAKLPAGAYTIAATHSGQTISKPAKVGASGRTQVSFVWAR